MSIYSVYLAALYNTGISDSNILSRLLVTYSTNSVKPRSDFLGSSLSFFVYYYFSQQ